MLLPAFLFAQIILGGWYSAVKLTNTMIRLEQSEGEYYEDDYKSKNFTGSTAGIIHGNHLTDGIYATGIH
jgi:hypothetical protein